MILNQEDGPNLEDEVNSKVNIEIIDTIVDGKRLFKVVISENNSDKNYQISFAELYSFWQLIVFEDGQQREIELPDYFDEHTDEIFEGLKTIVAEEKNGNKTYDEVSKSIIEKLGNLMVELKPVEDLPFQLAKEVILPWEEFDNIRTFSFQAFKEALNELEPSNKIHFWFIVSQKNESVLGIVYAYPVFDDQENPQYDTDQIEKDIIDGVYKQGFDVRLELLTTTTNAINEIVDKYGLEIPEHIQVNDLLWDLNKTLLDDYEFNDSEY